jgi:signal transduction histidine kinase
MPNVEIAANVIDGLISHDHFIAASRAAELIVSIALIWVLLVGLVRLGPRDNLWLAAVMAGLPLTVSIVGVATRTIWFPPVPYLAAVVIIVPYWGWRRLNAASVYFSDQLRMLEHDGRSSPGNESAPISGIGGDVVLQQITLLEDAKRRISDLRRFVDDILANFPDPVLIVDRAGQVLRVNGAAAQFAADIGISAESGAPVTPILAAITPSGAEGDAPWPPPEVGDGVPAARPRTGVGPDGRSYEFRFTRTSGADGAASGWIVHLADVTALVSAMRQREEALQLLSHDMRSPQSAILAVLGHPDFQQVPMALRRRIEGQARRTLDLADGFVRLAQAESADYAFEPIDLAHILQDAADAVWPLAQKAGLKVRFEPGDIEYVVLAERRLLTRALVNLLDNAVKFSPAGKDVTCRLFLDQLEGVEAVACEIADQAGGMAQAQAAELFQRFATSREDVSGSSGVGLGLALVHAVVTRHNGRIRCESAPGEGTVFTLVLPLCEAVPIDVPIAARA